MKQVMNYHKDNGLLNMIRRTDPMIESNQTNYIVADTNEQDNCLNTVRKG